MSNLHYIQLFTLFVVCYIQFFSINLVNCGDKGDIIIMGQKCSPTIVKTGKKGKKDLIIMGGGGCKKEKHEEHHTMHYPVPVIKYEKPKVYIKHEHIMHKPRYGGMTYDHSGYGGHYGGYHENNYEEIHHYGGMDHQYYGRK